MKLSFKKPTMEKILKEITGFDYVIFDYEGFQKYMINKLEEGLNKMKAKEMYFGINKLFVTREGYFNFLYFLSIKDREDTNKYDFIHNYAYSMFIYRGFIKEVIKDIPQEVAKIVPREKSFSSKDLKQRLAIELIKFTNIMEEHMVRRFILNELKKKSKTFSPFIYVKDISNFFNGRAYLKDNTRRYLDVMDYSLEEVLSSISVKDKEEVIGTFISILDNNNIYSSVDLTDVPIKEVKKEIKEVKNKALALL